MTDKAKQRALVYVALIVFLVVFVDYPRSEYEGLDRILFSVSLSLGTATGGLILGGIVAFILKFFWKKLTFYELWFSSASIWLGLFIALNIYGPL